MVRRRLLGLAKARVWKCYAKHQSPTFIVKTGTIFEDSPIGLEKWLRRCGLVVNCKNGISACELARDLGVTQRTAWFMAHRLRFSLKDGGSGLLSGECEADEAFIGGKARNMHIGKRKRRITEPEPKTKPQLWGFWSAVARIRAAVVSSTKSTRTAWKISGHF